MTSSSPPQNETTLHIQDITDKLSTWLEALNKAKDDYLKKSRAYYLKVDEKEIKEKQQDPEDSEKDGEVTQQVPKAGKTEKEEMEIANQLDKANKELNYMIGAFQKLVTFEVDISKSLETLEKNVKDIQADLLRASAYRIPNDSLKQAIERNLKVLRSNLTKVKILIPLQHQVSVAGPDERRYTLQTTVASKEVLPNPYEAQRIFESGSFVKEFQDHYEALDSGHKLRLLCFAIFPENAEIKKRLLRFWWLGERLTDPQKEDSGNTDPKEEDFVNKTLKEFIEKGFIVPVTKKSKSRDTSYKMHPIIRSLIIKLAKEANFFDYDTKGNPTMEISASTKSCLVKSEQGTPSWFSKNFAQSGIKQKPESSVSQQNKDKPGKELHQQEEHGKEEKQKQWVKQGTSCGLLKQQPESLDSHQNKDKPGKEVHHQEEHGKEEMQKQWVKQGTCCGLLMQQPESSDSQQNKDKTGKEVHQQEEHRKEEKQKQGVKQGTSCGLLKQQPESSDSQQNKDKPGKEVHQQEEHGKEEKQKQWVKQGTCCGLLKKQPESSDSQQNKDKLGKEVHQQEDHGKEEKQKQGVKQGTCCGFSKQSGTKQQPESSDNQRIKLEKQRQKNLEGLQTLFNVSKQFPDLPKDLFSKMRNIGVLYLGRWESTAERHIEVENAEFLDGLKNMKKLRFFSLQGISGISKLPKSLSQLTSLIVLDLRACYNLEKLPKEIASLKRLIRLDLSECYLLDSIPKRLSQLSNLEVLKGFVVSKNSSCTVQQLEALRKLEKLSINVNSEKFNIDEAGDVFFKLTALRKLKIAWGAEGSSKSKNGNNGKSGQNNGKKKDNAIPPSTADKIRDHPGSAVTAKLGGIMAFQKLKMPWVSCGEGSSKSGDNKGAKKRESDPAKSGVSNKDENVMKNLEKLDLQCFPGREPPKWLAPQKLKGLNYLCIRGGELSKLPSMPGDKKCDWEVETLRLKFLTDVKTNWKELRTQFPKLKYLEKVKCPQITFCPCDANGVWKSEQSYDQKKKSDNPEKFQEFARHVYIMK